MTTTDPATEHTAEPTVLDDPFLEPALAGAQSELTRLYTVARGHEGAVLSPAVDIVDHVRRVLLPTASPHYRADKSVPLVAAALRLEAATFAAYGEATAVANGDATLDQHDDLLDTVVTHIDAAVTASHAVLWDVARSGAPSDTSADALGTAAANLVALYTRLAAVARAAEG